MNLVRCFACVGLLAGMCVVVSAQSEKHGRKYTPPPVTTHIVVTVVKAFNGKPMDTVPVIFHAVKNGHDTGNMEVRTNTQGEATMDLIEAGSHVTVQVIASGYATDAEEFDVTDADKLVTVKMIRPRAQVSDYTQNQEKLSTLQPGQQVHIVPKPVPAVANTATPTTAPAASPAPASDPTAPTTAPTSGAAPSAPSTSAPPQ